MSIEVLRKIGLSQGELKVYSAMLYSGFCTVNRIHEKTGIERRNIYDILNKLIRRGFVTYITENRKRLFQISNPKKIIDYIEERKSDLEKVESEVKKSLPLIEKQFNLRQPEIGSEIYRGDNGIKAIWEDMLHSDALYWIGAGRYTPKKFPAWAKNWNKRRVKLGIMLYNLLRNEMKGKIDSWEMEECRFLPKEFSVNPAVISIHGDKVAHLLLGKDVFGFVIQSREIAENYRKYHKYLWDNAAKP